MSTKLKDILPWHSLENSTTLFEASAFRTTVRIFAALGLIYLASLVVSGSFLNTFTPSSHPAEVIFETLKRPVITFGLSLPIIALIANHHRSIQSERQLRTTQGQNILTNYVKHIEKFEEFLRDERIFENINDLRVLQKDLYHKIYSEAQNGELKPSKAFQHRLKLLRQKVSEIQEKLSKMTRDERQKSPEALGLMQKAVWILANNLCFEVVEKESDLSRLGSLSTILMEICELCKEIDKCTGFIFPSNCSEDLRAINESVMRITFSLYRSQSGSTEKPLPNDPRTDGNIS